MNNKDFVERLFEARSRHCCKLPLRSAVQKFADDSLKILFPHFSEEQYSSALDIQSALRFLCRDLKAALSPMRRELPKSEEEIHELFCNKYPAIHEALELDAKAIYEGDPAAKDIDEVILAYPGFYAIAIHRIAHEFYRMSVPYFPRMLSEYAHSKTGIDIHPGARIGQSFCIDHGTGVVIGETTEIGDFVKIYQGVTFGALSVNKDLSLAKRHPTIESHVVVYSNATILGGDTVVGQNSIIGGNVWLTKSVPAYSTVYHTSEVQIREGVTDLRQSIAKARMERKTINL